jgi:hypothetical protein
LRIITNPLLVPTHLPHRSKTGTFKELVAIPADTAGYIYKVKARVVASPFYPWAKTYSPVVSQRVG